MNSSRLDIGDENMNNFSHAQMWWQPKRTHADFLYQVKHKARAKCHALRHTRPPLIFTPRMILTGVPPQGTAS